jgi:hypothetical protein
MNIRNIIATNSFLFSSNCLQKLCDDMIILQQNIDLKYYDSNYLRENLIRVCKNHSAFVVELHNTSINSFFLLIHSASTLWIEKQRINWQSIHIFRASTIRLTINVTINVSRIDNIVVNFFDNRDNDRFSLNSSHRDKFSIRAFKICFVCDKFACWSTNHIEKKREKSKKRFINRNSIFKTRSKLKRRFKQFIVDYENNNINEFII